MSTARKVIQNGSELVSIAEASDIMCVSYATAYAMYRKGASSIKAMGDMREVINNRENYKGGKVAVTKKTSKGMMTVPEMHRYHPHGLGRMTITSRGHYWGFDHKCIWLPKAKSNYDFRATAIALDGLPRGTGSGSAGTVIADAISKQSKTDSEVINRLKCCHRDKGRIKCRHYAKRLKIDKGYPKECKIASGEKCKNFDGIEIEVAFYSSNHGIKHYAPNGTEMCLR